VSLAHVDRLLARACTEPSLQEQLVAAQSLDAVITMAAQRGLSITVADLNTSMGSGHGPSSGVVRLISAPGFDWLSHLIRLTRGEARAA